MTRSKLKAVAPKAAEPSKPKILIYGKPGVQKTWVSLDFPSAYYIDTEGGANLPAYTDKLDKSGGVYFGIDQGSLSFSDIIDQVRALATEQHSYKTLVIDSISRIFNYEVTKEGERLGDKNAFGADKKPALAMMRRLIDWLLRLDMNVILIAHQKAEWGLDAKRERTEVGTTFDCWDKLEYELHLVLNIIKQGESHKAFVRKSRLPGFPSSSVFEWSFDEFAARYGRAAIEGDHKPIQLASQEQLTEMNGLIELMRVPEEHISKWLTKANVDSLAEMDSEKIALIITYLKSKITNPGQGE